MTGFVHPQTRVIISILVGLGLSDCQLVEGRTGEPCEVYAASPYGFTPSTWSFLEKELYPTIEAAGCSVIDPWDLKSLKQGKATMPALQQGEVNAKNIENEATVGLVAVLDGPDVDSGTAAEIGYAAANKKWVIGYRRDSRRTGDAADVTVNMQVEYFICVNGGEIVHELSEITRAIRARIRGDHKQNALDHACYRSR